jgi:L-ascorbate metabolism protein UlaG (beta-lactamase superfamily)
LFEYRGVRISWLGHGSFRLKNGKTLVIDPFRLKAVQEKADLILITHEHFDHLSLEDVRKVVSEETVVIATPSCEDVLSKLKVRDLKLVRPGDTAQVGEVVVEAVPAYNLNKYRSPGHVFHPKEEGKVGYIVTLKGVRIYHAGDTDAIPEMSRIKPDIALVPVSGTYVMTSEEAAKAVTLIKPKLAIPMHYGIIVGSAGDAEKFKKLADCPVQILTPD